MKRSEIEAAVAAARTAFAEAGLALPPFADWDHGVWRETADSHAAKARLGWDVTDFRLGDFTRKGLVLFTLRNGDVAELKAGRGFCYCEKAMLVGNGQVTPMHHHRLKVEDIIVRGPGTLALELRHAGPDGKPDRSRGTRVLSDGRWRETDADGLLCLRPGESVTLPPDIWHSFWGNGGPVVVGEVSSVNDDVTDNYFEEPLPRFPEIEEDAPATVPLVSER